MSRRSAFIFVLLCSVSTFGQKVTFSNPIDKDLTIKTLTVAQAHDNLAGIYARPLTEHLRSLVANDKQWVVKAYPENLKISPEQYEDKSELVKSTLKSASSDALISMRISKGPKGLSIKMNLFAGKDGLLLAQETLSDYSGFEIADLKAQLTSIYESLKHKIPYDGTILSRKGLLVTVDLGTNQGLREDNNLTVIQIVKITRHPRFKFIVSAEKEIIGKIQLTKVEENLSFGSILSERDAGVIQVGQKFIVENFVRYPQPIKTGDGKINDDLGQRPDSGVAFGEQAKEWVPSSAPTYGKLGVQFGLGTYQINSTVSQGGGLSAGNPLTPSIHLNGEMWLSPNWIAELNLRQFILTLSNPYPGSSPSKLNLSTTQYTLLGGYNFLVADEFFGPKVQVLGGYSMMKSVVDQSTPVALTNMAYSGLVFGLGGSFPLDFESRLPFSLGARLNLFWNPSLDESPSSGSPTNSVTSFNAFVDYRYSQHMVVKAQVAYDLFSSTFSGRGSRTETATSTSHGLTTISGGIEYLF